MTSVIFLCLGVLVDARAIAIKTALADAGQMTTSPSTLVVVPTAGFLVGNRGRSPIRACGVSTEEIQSIILFSNCFCNTTLHLSFSDNQRGIVIALHSLGKVLHEQERLDEAAETLWRSHTISQELGDQLSLAMVLRQLVLQVLSVTSG